MHRASTKTANINMVQNKHKSFIWWFFSVSRCMTSADVFNLSIRLEYRSIATSRGFPAELGKHPSNVNVHEKNMAAPNGNNASKSPKLNHFDC